MVPGLLLETLGLHGPTDVAGLGRRWAGLDPSGLAALTDYEGCTLWLYRRLNELSLLQILPDRFAQWLRGRARRLEARNLLVDAQRDDLVGILNDFRVPHVLLKGAARRLAADRYPYADARLTSDVDVLVPENQALPTWERLLKAGFSCAAGTGQAYRGHIHLPPLVNGRAVTVEIHTSTSSRLPAERAWERLYGSACAATCDSGPTRIPGATELLWHAISHAPLPHSYAFRLRFFQDARVIWPAPDVDWSEIAGRLASPELPNSALARLWVGTAARLAGHPTAPSQLGALPALDFRRALRWRLTVFRLVAADSRHTAPLAWGPDPSSRGRRLLIDEGTRAELGLPLTPPPRGCTPPRRAARRVLASAARLCYRGWRMLQPA